MRFNSFTLRINHLLSRFTQPILQRLIRIQLQPFHFPRQTTLLPFISLPPRNRIYSRTRRIILQHRPMIRPRIRLLLMSTILVRSIATLTTLRLHLLIQVKRPRIRLRRLAHFRRSNRPPLRLIPTRRRRLPWHFKGQSALGSGNSAMDRGGVEFGDE